MIVMKTNLSQNQSRREFFLKTSKIGLTCGLFSLCAHNCLGGQEEETKPIPDPKKLNYCGYSCPPDCFMKQAGLSDDIEMKKKAYEIWDLKNRYGLDFDPDQILCNGCKTDEKELGMAVSNCAIRKCAIEKKIDCCIECDELATCGLSNWKIFPDFYKSVIEMQKRYRAAG